MITYHSNFGEVIDGRIECLKNIDTQRICMAQAALVVAELRKRIHQEGKAADGSQIGTYSEGYMKVRAGDYGNRKRVTKGKRKGQAKEDDAGVFTRGKNKGSARPRYNRDADTRVVASLTREMEGALTVIPTETGAGVGWRDDYNFQKHEWVEACYGKKIWALTANERDAALRVGLEELEKQLIS